MIKWAFIPKMWGCFNIWKLVNVINHINSLKKKKKDDYINWYIKSIHHDEILIHDFLKNGRKTVRKLIEVNVFNLTKNTYKKSTDNILFKDKKLQAFQDQKQGMDTFFHHFYSTFCWKSYIVQCY